MLAADGRKKVDFKTLSLLLLVCFPVVRTDELHAHMTSSHLYDVTNGSAWGSNSLRSSQLQCPDCDVTVSTIGALTAHLLADHAHPEITDVAIDTGDACSECAGHVTRDAAQPEVGAAENGQNVSSDSSHDAGDDSVDASLPVSLECPYCQRKDFDSIGPLAAHIRTAHSKPSDNLFSCDVCSLAFATVSKLQQHQQQSHLHSSAMSHRSRTGN